MIMATLLAGAALTFFTAGLSNAASAAVVSSATSGLAAIAVRLAFVLSGKAAAMAALQCAMMTVMARLAMGMGFSLISSVFVKAVVQDLNVLDPASWNAADASKLLLDGTLVIGMASIARTPGIATRLAGPTGTPSFRRQLVGGASFGAPASATFSFTSQFGFQGKSLTDADAWEEVAYSTAVGGIAGFGAAGLFHGGPRVVEWTRRNGMLRPGITTTIEPPLIDIHLADVMRASTGLVSDAINYWINYPEPDVMPTPPPLAPGATPPVLPTTPVASAPTGTTTARPGDSLSGIAGRVYGDPNRWPDVARANPQITNPNHIHPGDVINVPRLEAEPPPDRPPAPPPTFTVRRGDSLWVIAERVYGDGFKYRLIAEANNIGPPYTIYRGQSLTIPRLPVPVP